MPGFDFTKPQRPTIHFGLDEILLNIETCKKRIKDKHPNRVIENKPVNVEIMEFLDNIQYFADVDIELDDDVKAVL